MSNNSNTKPSEISIVQKNKQLFNLPISKLDTTKFINRKSYKIQSKIANGTNFKTGKFDIRQLSYYFNENLKSLESSINDTYEIFLNFLNDLSKEEIRQKIEIFKYMLIVFFSKNSEQDKMIKFLKETSKNNIFKLNSEIDFFEMLENKNSDQKEKNKNEIIKKIIEKRKLEINEKEEVNIILLINNLIEEQKEIMNKIENIVSEIKILEINEASEIVPHKQAEKKELEDKYDKIRSNIKELSTFLIDSYTERETIFMLLHYLLVGIDTALEKSNILKNEKGIGNNNYYWSLTKIFKEILLNSNFTEVKEMEEEEFIKFLNKNKVTIIDMFTILLIDLLKETEQKKKKNETKYLLEKFYSNFGVNLNVKEIKLNLKKNINFEEARKQLEEEFKKISKDIFYPILEYYKKTKKELLKIDEEVIKKIKGDISSKLELENKEIKLIFTEYIKLKRGHLFKKEFQNYAKDPINLKKIMDYFLKKDFFKLQEMQKNITLNLENKEDFPELSEILFNLESINLEYSSLIKENLKNFFEISLSYVLYINKEKFYFDKSDLEKLIKIINSEYIKIIQNLKKYSISFERLKYTLLFTANTDTDIIDNFVLKNSLTKEITNIIGKIEELIIIVEKTETNKENFKYCLNKKNFPELDNDVFEKLNNYLEKNNREKRYLGVEILPQLNKNIFEEIAVHKKKKAETLVENIKKANKKHIINNIKNDEEKEKIVKIYEKELVFEYEIEINNSILNFCLLITNIVNNLYWVKENNIIETILTNNQYEFKKEYQIFEYFVNFLKTNVELSDFKEKISIKDYLNVDGIEEAQIQLFDDFINKKGVVIKDVKNS